MIPYKIVGTTNYRPYIAFFVTVVNVLAFVYVLTYAFLGGLALEEVYRNYALNICAVRAQPLAETLLDGTRSIFLHMSFVHLTSNIVIFYVFGSRIEEHLGHLRFLAFYLIVGFGGHLGHLLLDGGQCGEALYMIGSSGAISGIIGAFLILVPDRPHQVKNYRAQSLRLRCQRAGLGISGLLVFHAILLSSRVGGAADQRPLGACWRFHDRSGRDISVVLFHRSAAHTAGLRRGRADLRETKSLC